MQGKLQKKSFRLRMAKIEFMHEPSKSTKQANPPYTQIHELIYARPRIPATQSPSPATDSRNPRNCQG